MTLGRTGISVVLLSDGVLLILLGFAHLLATPIIMQSMAGELTGEVLTRTPVPILVNHLFLGVLLIPFGVSTLYTAAGIRAGHRWARFIAGMNALGVLALPFTGALLSGPSSVATGPALAASIFITLIGLSMILILLWLRGEVSGRTGAFRPKGHDTLGPPSKP